MPRYYNFSSNDVDVKATAPTLGRKFWPLPYLTGDPISIKIFAKWANGTPVTRVYFSLDHKGKSIIVSDSYPMQAQYKPIFTRYDTNGESVIMMVIEKTFNNVGAVHLSGVVNTYSEKVATIHMVDNWRWLVALFIVIMSALITLVSNLIFFLLTYHNP